MLCMVQSGEMNCCTELGRNKADRIIIARQSHISTYRGEAFVTAEEGGNCRLF